MKRDYFGFLLTVVVLSIIAMAVACGSGREAGNQNVAQNASNAELHGSSVRENVCEIGNFNQKAEKVQERILAKFSGKLKKQHSGEGPNSAIFKFRVEKADGEDYLIAYFEGLVLGSDELKNLADLLNDFGKDQCLMKVVFVPAGSIKEGEKVTAKGFEWSGCEWPDRVCKHGSCGNPCVGLTPDIKVTNSNSNANSY